MSKEKNKQDYKKDREIGSEYCKLNWESFRYGRAKEFCRVGTDGESWMTETHVQKKNNKRKQIETIARLVLHTQKKKKKTETRWNNKRFNRKKDK